MKLKRAQKKVISVVSIILTMLSFYLPLTPVIAATVPTGSVTVNYNAGITHSNKVSLIFNVNNSAPAQVLVSENPAFTGAVWESYTPTKSFTLSAGNGTKTVYVKFKDSSGAESVVYNDSITLDTTPPANFASLQMLQRGTYFDLGRNFKNEDYINIDGNRMVYSDNPNGNYDIYMRDLTTGQNTQITNNTAIQGAPRISGNYIIYKDGRNGVTDLYMYNLSNGTEQYIDTLAPTAMTDPTVNSGWYDINGSNIVYYKAGTNSLNIYNINTGATDTLITGNYQLPRIYGNYVVARQYFLVNGVRNYTMHLIDITTKAAKLISPAEGYFVNQVLNQDYVVYFRSDPDGLTSLANKKMFVYNIAAGTLEEISAVTGVDNVKLYGSKVYYIDSANGNMATYDIVTRQSASYINPESRVADYCIYNNKPVFVGDYTGQWGVYTTSTGYSVRINNGDDITHSQKVTINVDGTAKQIMVSESSDFTGAVWENYYSNKAFTLSAGNGTKTVYVKFIDSTGLVSPAYFDSITLDTAPANFSPMQMLQRDTYFDLQQGYGNEDYINLDGKYLVYTDNSTGNLDVYLRDFNNGTTKQLTADSSIQASPRISNNHVVWEDSRNGRTDLYVYDIITNTEEFIDTLDSKLLSESSSVINYDINGNYIVYRTADSNMYLYDITTNTKSLLVSGPYTSPKIAGDYVVARQVTSVNNVLSSSLYLINIWTKEVKQISPADEGYYTGQVMNQDYVAFYTAGPNSKTSDRKMYIYNIGLDSLYQVPNLTGMTTIYIDGIKVYYTDGYNNNIMSYDVVSQQTSLLLSPDSRVADYVLYDSKPIFVGDYTGQWGIYTLPIIINGNALINNGDNLTHSTKVSISCDFILDGGTISKMMVSEDPSFTGALWDNYGTKSFTLSPGDGVKTVYVKLKDNLGAESKVYSDSIALSTQPPDFSAVKMLTRDTYFDRNKGYASEDYLNFDGNRLVYTDNPYGNQDVFLLDINTGQTKQLTTDTSIQASPRISGNYIVWEDGRNGQTDLYLYSMTTGTDQYVDTMEGRSITDVTYTNVNYDISSQYIVYRKADSTGTGLYLHNLATGTNELLVSGNYQLPRIYGNYVVARDINTSNGISTSEIYLINIQTKETKLISPSGDYFAGQVINQDYVAFFKTGTFSTNADKKLYVYQISTGTLSVVPGITGVQATHLFGNKVYYLDANNNNIMSYDLDTRQINTFMNPDGRVADFTLYGKRPIFVGDYTGKWGIYTTPITYSISINSGSTLTRSNRVSLDISNTSLLPVQQMMVSDDANFTGAVWEPYTTSKPWTLSGGNGTKTVYVKFMDNSGMETPAYSDIITLDTTTPINMDLVAMLTRSAYFDQGLTRNYEEYLNVDGNQAVYTDNPAGNLDVFLYNRSTGQTTQLTNAAGNQYSPRISGNYVAWEDTRNGATDLYLYDLTTNTEKNVDRIENVVRDPASAILSFGLDGQNLVYRKTDANGASTLNLYNIATGVKTVLAAGTYQNPQIYGNKVVCRQTVSKGVMYSTLYLIDINTKQMQAITPTDGFYTGAVLNQDFVGYLSGGPTATQQERKLYIYNIAAGTTEEVPNITGVTSLRIYGSDLFYNDSYTNTIMKYNTATKQVSKFFIPNSRVADYRVYDNGLMMVGDYTGQWGIYSKTTLINNLVSNVTVSPNPIKIGSSVSISYTLSQTCYVNIYAYNEAGELVKKIAGNLYKGAGTYPQSWDGKDSSGNLVKDGYYKIVVEATDVNGIVIGSGEKVQLAAQVPVVSSSSAAPNPFNPGAGETATISYNLSTNSLVSVQILKGTTPVRTVISNQSQSAGPNSVIWDGKDNNGAILGDGPYTYQIDATSQLVPTFKAVSAKGTINLEKGAPVVTNLNVSANPYKLGTSLTISYTLSENGKVTVRVLDSAGNVVKTPLDNVAKNAGANTATWDGKDSSGTMVPDGIYTVSVIETDNYNNVSPEATKSFTGAAVPAITGAVVAPNVFNPANGETATISYNLSTDALVTVQIFKGTAAVRTIVSNQNQAAGTNSLDWDGLDNSGKPVGDGPYTYQIDATSKLVPTFKAVAVKGTVSVEQGPPVITDLTLSANPYKLGTSLTIKYTLSENGKVSLSVLDENGAVVRTLLNGVAKTAGANTTTWDGKDSTGKIVPDGNYTIVATEVDNYGNPSLEVTKTITGASVPVITGAAATPVPVNPMAGETATISYSLSTDALVSVKILKGTTTVRTIVTDLTQSAGPNSVDWDGRDNAGNFVGDGPYTFQIDAASLLVPTFKAISVKGTFNVEQGAPLVTNITASANPYKLGTSLTIGFTLSENGKVTVEILDETGTVVRTPLNNVAKNAGTITATWDGKDAAGKIVPDGTYTIAVTEVDNYNNVSDTITKTITGASVPAITGAMVTPNPVNPLSGETATISYNLSTDAAVTVQILKGTTSIRTLVSNQTQFAGPNSVDWDGTDNSGKPVGDGPYTYQIDAANLLVPTFKAIAAKGTFYVEQGAPTVTNLSTGTNPYKLGTSLTISYTLSENGKVTVSILDETGNVVRTVLNNTAKNAGANTATWDGKDSLGMLVPDGNYTIVVSEVDNYGNISEDATKTITAAKVPAITGATAAPNPFNPANGEAATINYNLSTDALVTAQILKGTTSIRTVVLNQTQFAGPNSIEWDGKDNNGNIVGDGSYTFQIDAASSLVPTFKATAVKITVNVEQGPPEITNLNTSANPYKIGTNLTISYTLSENGKVTILVLDEGGNVVRTIASSLAKNAGANTAIWNGRDNSGVLVPDGSYTILLSEVDNYGNVSTDAVKTIIAAAVPAISGVTVSPNPFNPTNGETALISYNLSTDALVTVQILKGTTVVRTLATGLSQFAGINSIEWDGKDNNGNIVGDGPYTYQIDAASLLVPTFKATAVKGTVNVEQFNPVVSGLTVSSNPYKLGTSLTITYNLSENGKVTIVVKDSADNVVRTIAGDLAKIAGKNTATWDGRDNSGVLVPNGSYTIVVSETDNYNNVSDNATITVTAALSPTVSALSASPNPFNPLDAVQNQATINYTISCEALVTVKIYLGTTLKRTLLLDQTQAAGANSVVWDGKDDNGNLVANGTYTYQIDAVSPMVSTFKSTMKGTLTVQSL